MSNRLGGTLFIRNGVQFDYCFKEAIECLKQFCNEVIVVDAGSDDGTVEILKSLEDNKTKIIYLDKEEWESQHGREKLNYFTNKAIEQLTCEWNFCLQADEILTERSYGAVREAINSNIGEAYMCTRVNLWGSPYKQLNVPQNRMPCSFQIIRLAKSIYRSFGDAESIDAQCKFDFVDKIRIYHYGFVRKKEVMKAKIVNMQRDVFQVPVDEKLKDMEVFDSTAWFSESDLRLIDEPPPLIIREWISSRP